MKKIYKDEKEVELEIRKDKNITEYELDKIDKNALLKSLQEFYYKEENYYELYINENQIQKRNIPLDELVKKIDENPESTIEPRKRKNKTNKAQSNPVENIIQEDNKIQEENIIQEKNKNVIKRVENLTIINIAKNKNKEDAQKIIDNQIDLQKDKKTKTRIENIDNSSKESQYNQIPSVVNELMSKIDELKSQINDLKEKDKIKTNNINQLTSQVNDLNEKDKIKTNKINELNEKNKDKDNRIKEMSSKIKKNKMVIKNTINNLRNLEMESLAIKSELKILIQLRDVFRNIIDLFCKAYKMRLNDDYITKILAIQNKISIQTIKEDEKIKLINFFKKIYFQYQFGNKKAHTIDLSQSIIDQVFAYIDPKNELENVKIKFKKGQMNSLLKRHTLNRLNNFNDKTYFEKVEKEIIESVSNPSDIYPNA